MSSPPMAYHLHVVVGVSTLSCTGEAKSLLYNEFVRAVHSCAFACTHPMASRWW